MNLSNLICRLKLKVLTHSKQLEQFLNKKKFPSFENQFIYFARYGKSFDGHQFALEVIRSKNFLVGEASHLNQFSHILKNEILNSNFFICVENVEHELNEYLKKEFKNQNYHPMSIGITGTSGKTSVVQIVGQVLNLLTQNKVMKIGTLGIEIGAQLLDNSHQTTPDYPAFMESMNSAKDLDISHVIMEVSSHGLAENRLNDYKFDIAGFTNFSQDHLDFHGSMEEYFSAKMLLFSKHLKENGTCIINTQTEKWMEILESAAHSHRTIYLLIHENELFNTLRAQSFIKHFKNAYFLILSNAQSTFQGIEGRLKLLDAHQNLISSHNFSASLIGNMNFENFMMSYCICHACKFNPDDFVPLFSKVSGIPGRMQPLYSKTISESPLVIVDYSHKPEALEKALKTLKNLAPKQKLIAVFGCGGDRDSSKRRLMGEISAHYADVTILTSDNPRTEDPQNIINDIRLGVPKESCYFEEIDRQKAIEKAFKIAKKSDIILIAGKGHESYQIIGTLKKEFSDVKIAKHYLM